MSAENEEKRCEFDPGSGCAALRIKDGEPRENCLLCIITQQNSELKNACRVILANSIQVDQGEALSVMITAVNSEKRFKLWVEKHRGELLKQIQDEVKEHIENGEPMIFGPDGLMSREEALARLIGLGKQKDMNPV